MSHSSLNRRMDGRLDRLAAYFLLGLANTLYVVELRAQESGHDRKTQLQVELDSATGEDRIPLLVELAESHKKSAAKIFELTDEVLELLADQPDPKNEARTRVQRSWAHQLSGDYALALREARVAERLAAKLGEQSILARSLYMMSVVNWRQSNIDTALKLASRARQIQTSVESDADLAKTLTLLGAIHRSQSSYDKAIELHLESQRISENLNDQSGIARSLNNIGLIYWNIGRHDDAHMTLLEALETYRQAKDFSQIPTCLNNIGLILIELDQPKDAIPHLEDSLSLHTRDGNSRGRAKALSNLGFAHESMGEIDLALDFYQQSLDLRKKCGDKTGVVRTSGSMAAIYQSRADHRTALPILQEALMLAEQIGARSEQASLLELISRARAELGDPIQALEDYRRFHRLRTELVGSEVQQRIAELENRHAIEKSEREIGDLKHAVQIRKQQIERQNAAERRLLTGSLLLTACLVLVIGLYSSRVKALSAVRLANRKLISTTDRLAESEKRYRTLFDRADIPMMLIEEETSLVVDLNKPARDLCGSLEGGELPLSKIQPEWVRMGVSQQLAKATSDFSEEDCWVESAGNLRFAEIRGTTVLLNGTKVKLVSIRDTTEVRAQEKAQLRTDRLESLGVLAGGIAHDFNNALTAIQGYVELARNQSAGQATEELDLVVQAAAQARRLTSQLLAFSKGGEPVRHVQDVGQLLKQGIELGAAGSKMSIRVDLDDDLWPAELDSGQFTQVVSNLVLNAEQATDEAGTLHVVATNHCRTLPSESSTNVRECVRIDFIDNGVGIASDIRDKIFDPYFTTKNGSNGLGLATAFAVVNRHGGTITVSSREGDGATFSVFIPASPHSVAGTLPVSEKDLAGQGSILVLEDEPLVQKVYELMLMEWGFDVEIVDDGETAVDRYAERHANKNSFDLLIMDLTIRGGMGGHEAMTRILELDPSAVAIVASGYSDDPIMANHKEAGFSAAISKPFSAHELARVISTLIARNPSAAFNK